MTVLLNPYHFSVAVPFVPTDIAGLQLWLKADALAQADGSEITSWTDSSGNDRHATGLTTFVPTFETGELNGKPVARFNGTSHALTVPDAPELDLGSGEGMTVFVVVKSNTSGRGIMAKRDGSANGWQMFHASGKILSTVDVTSAASATSTTTITAAWNILTGIRDADGETVRIRVNGPSEATATLAGDASNAIALHIGSLVSTGLPASFLAGDIAEILIYDTGLGLGDLNAVGNYLKDKYALSWTNQ